MDESGASIASRDKAKKRDRESSSLTNLAHQYQKRLELQGRRVIGFRYALNYLYRFVDSHEDLYGLPCGQAQNFQSFLIQHYPQLSPATRSVIISSLSSFYSDLKKRKLILENPFELIDRMRVPRKLPSQIPDEKEISDLLDHLSRFTKGKNLSEYKRDYKAHILCELLYSTGMRVSDAAALRVDDVNLDEGTLLIHDVKNHSERIGFLNDYTRRILTFYLQQFRKKVLFPRNGADKDRLFGSKTNLKVWLNTLLARACQQLGIRKITTHYFRHAFGYHMLRAGCDIRVIQDFLGHRRLNSTGVYTKVDKHTLRHILDRYHPRSAQP